MLPPPRRSISGMRRARQRYQRVSADVERLSEAFARGLNERRRQLFARRKCGAVHDEVEAAELSVDRLEHCRDLTVVGDVARQDQRIAQVGGEVANVLLEALALIRDRQPGTRGRRRLRDRPGDRALVRHADDQSGLAFELRHLRRSECVDLFLRWTLPRYRRRGGRRRFGNFATTV